MNNIPTFEEFLNEKNEYLNERTKFDVQKLLSKVDDELYNIIKWKDDASCYVSAPADANDIIDAVKSKYPKSSWDPKTNLLVFESEEFLNEGINVKDIKVGTILNFKDGETWKVTKTPGISTGKIFAAPYGDTRKSYISIAIEYQIDKLKQDVKSISESQEFIGESKISEIFLMANYAKSFTAFRKEFMDEYGKPKSAKELQQIEAWLQTIWNNREVQKNENHTVDFELDEAAEVSVDVALSPANKKKLKNAFETEFLGIDKLTFKKDGTIVAKKGYFYRHGDSPEKTANNLKTKLSHLGIEIEVKDAYDDFKPWPKDSNFVIEFKIIN